MARATPLLVYLGNNTSHDRALGPCLTLDFIHHADRLQGLVPGLAESSTENHAGIQDPYGVIIDRRPHLQAPSVVSPGTDFFLLASFARLGKETHDISFTAKPIWAL